MKHACSTPHTKLHHVHQRYATPTFRIPGFNNVHQHAPHFKQDLSCMQDRIRGTVEQKVRAQGLATQLSGFEVLKLEEFQGFRVWNSMDQASKTGVLWSEETHLTNGSGGPKAQGASVCIECFKH